MNYQDLRKSYPHYNLHHIIKFYIAGHRSPTPCTDLSSLLSQGPIGTGELDGSPTSTLGVFLDCSAEVSHPAITEPLVKGKIS